MPKLQLSFRTRPLALPLVLAASLAGACAEERPPINHVQPNALAKSFFVAALGDPSDDPQFYYRPTVVDVDYGAGQSTLFTASYAQTLVRIRWEISEDLLLARLAYDRIDGTSGDVEEGSEGQIVAAFAIDSHFDIKRGYNPQTGEELNVIEENTDDRPWYERDFMRVDWSQNLITTAYDLDTLAALKAFADNPLTYEPVAYYVEDPNHPDKPWFSPEEGYFDITNKVYATPNLVETPWGTMPACFFSQDVFGGSYPDEDCNPVEVKLRLSFKQVADSDYEPVNWDGQRQNMFGMFTTASRLGYDRSYGVVDQKWYRFASRHNIWRESHFHDQAGNTIPCNTPETTGTGGDPRRDIDPADGTDDECAAAGPGSRCDVYKQACTEPYRTRDTRTIPVYYGPGSDPALWETSRDVTAQWDSALRQAVQTARYGECLSGMETFDEDAIEACKSEYPPTLEAALEAVPEILVFCHNPVESGDHPECGPPGLAPRVGDLRYHMVNIIEDPQTDSPWGILADAIDPLTGEVVAASINVWNARTDIATQQAIDMMRWYNGELSNTDVSTAQYLGDLITENTRRSPGWTSPPTFAPTEIEQRIANLDRSLVGGEAIEPPRLSARALLTFANDRARERFGDLSGGDTAVQTRMALAKDGAVETSLMTGPYYDLARLPTSTPIDQTVLDLVSPLRGNLFGFKTALARERHRHLAEKGRCMLEGPEPSSVVDLGRFLDAKFPLDSDPDVPGVQASADSIYDRNQKWRDYVRRRITHGVLAHEMGHSMGLRHVFTSSFDALNYRPQYWQLRTRDGQETEYCTGPTDDGTACVGPRWLDPVTDAERYGMIYRWQQTSVMEYPGDITQEMLDIGPYDRAALRFAYADMVDIWDSEDARCTVNGSNCTRNGGTLRDLLDTFGGIGGVWYGFQSGEAFHYSLLQNELGLIRNCQPANLDPPADYDADRDGLYIPELDGNIVNGTVCESVPVDYVPFRKMSRISNPNNGPESKFDPLGRVRKPYLFASDEWADIGNLAVRRGDNGADAYEVTTFLISEYEDRHLWDNYRRNRTNFTLTRALNRSYARYLEHLKDMSKAYSFLHDLYSAAGFIDGFLEGPEADGTLLPSALAVSTTFDQFARILTRPQNGPHLMRDDPVLSLDVLRWSEGNSLQNIRDVDLPDGTIGVGSNVWFSGRPLQNDFDDSKGYYAVDYQLQAGSYYDKTQVIELLSDSTSRFVDANRDDFYDYRYRTASVASLYPEGVRRLVANALTEDADILGWRVAATLEDGTNPEPEIDDDFAPVQPLGSRVWWPTEGAPVCWPQWNSNVCVAYPDGSTSPSLEPAASVALDPQLGFEVQKFIIFWALTYLPENWKLDWVDMMRIWVIGSDADPQIPDAERIAWRDPQSGQLYVARRYGREQIDGRTVERGIAARVIEWMNLLTEQAYEISAENADTGELTVERHPDDSDCPSGVTSCAGQPVEKTPEYTIRTKNYKSVLDFMRQVTATYGFYDPAWRGLYQ